MLEGLGRRFLCTLPVEDLAEAVKKIRRNYGLFLLAFCLLSISEKNLLSRSISAVLVRERLIL